MAVPVQYLSLHGQSLSLKMNTWRNCVSISYPFSMPPFATYIQYFASLNVCVWGGGVSILPLHGWLWICKCKFSALQAIWLSVSENTGHSQRVWMRILVQNGNWLWLTEKSSYCAVLPEERRELTSEKRQQQWVSVKQTRMEMSALAG